MRNYLSCSLLIILILIGVIYEVDGATYEVETKYGIKELVVPDESTELQVLLILARSYYELDHEYSEITNQIEELLSTIDAYKVTVHSYQVEVAELETKYKDLIENYDILLRAKNPPMRFLAGVNAELDSIGVELGIQLLDTIQITAALSGLNRVQIGVTAVL